MNNVCTIVYIVVIVVTIKLKLHYHQTELRVSIQVKRIYYDTNPNDFQFVGVLITHFLRNPGEFVPGVFSSVLTSPKTKQFLLYH